MSTYTKGNPGAVQHTGGSCYDVQSFKQPTRFYAVNLAAGTCSCPDFAKRGGPCKHTVEATRVHEHKCFEKAMELDLPTLRKHAARTDLRGEVLSAIHSAIFRKVRQIARAA